MRVIDFQTMLYMFTMARYRQLITPYDVSHRSFKGMRKRRKVKGVKYFGTYRPIRHFGE